MPYVIDHKNYDELPDRMQERICEKHMVAHMKNAMGRFVCPVCLVEENE